MRLIQPMVSHTETAMLTPMQLRAAGALIGWSREDLAKKAGIAAVTVRAFELLGADSKQSTIFKMRRALEIAGVVFIEDGGRSDDGGPGVRLRTATARRNRQQ